MIRSILLLLSLLCLTACSSLEFAVDWADTYLENEIDNYFDLDKSQSNQLDKSLKEQILLTRQQQLPRFAEELRAVADEIQNAETLSAAQVEKVFLRVQDQLAKSIASLEPKAQDFLAGIKTEQMKVFEKEFKKQTDKIRDKNSNEKKILENHIEQVEKQLRYWTGSLSRQQSKDITEFCKAHPYPIQERIQNREKISTDFMTSFAVTEKRKNFIRTLLTDYKTLYLPAYAEKSAEYGKHFSLFVAGFINKMTPDEKKKLVENIRKRATELQRIAEKTPGFKSQ